MKYTLNALVLGGLLAVAPAIAQAAPQVLFTQGITQGASSIASTAGNGFSQFEVGDNFTLDVNAQLTSISFFGNRSNPQFADDDDFTISIYADDPAFPGAPSIAPLWSSQVGEISETLIPQTDIQDNDLFQYEIAIAGPSLLAGQQYWITIVNALSDRGDWFWSTSNDGDDFNAGRSLLGAPVDFDVFNDGDLAFSLTGEASEVPTPASFALLGAGLALAALARRKRA